MQAEQTMIGNSFTLLYQNIKVREEGLDPTIVYALCGVREYVPLLSGMYYSKIFRACQAKGKKILSFL